MKESYNYYQLLDSDGESEGLYVSTLNQQSFRKILKKWSIQFEDTGMGFDSYIEKYAKNKIKRIWTVGIDSPWNFQNWDDEI